MRIAKRLAVAGIVSIIAIGVAPGQNVLTAGGKVSPGAISCCRS